MSKLKKGKVYLVGAGPGRPDLITVRGLNVLREADVIIYDYLVDKKILEHAEEDAEKICSDQLGKKRFSDGSAVAWQRINDLMIKKAKEGKKVVRLKNGDTSLFSRESQELEALRRERIRFELVPGLTSASAASSFTGIPLTDRRYASSCVFVTGHEDPMKKKSLLDWESLAKNGTIVLYMAVEHLKNIVKRLIENGKDKNTQVAIIENASLLTQRIIKGTLGNIIGKAKEDKIRPPAIIIIGNVVKFEKEFNWLKKEKRILFTGLSSERFFTDGIYFHLPLIRIEPMEHYKEFDDYLRNIKAFHWVVFASRYGVEYFFKRLKALGLDSRVLSNIKIAAIGNSTKNRLLDFGISADLVPEKESSSGLIEAFKRVNLKGKNMFLPRSDISDKGLEKELKKLGADVTTGFAYRNVMPKDLPDLDLDLFDEIMFTSPSTVRNFKRRYKGLPRGVKVRCIGEVTKKEVNRILR